MNFQNKYKKYKAKYINLKQMRGGSKIINVIIIDIPNMYKSDQKSKFGNEITSILKNNNNIKIHHYEFLFSCCNKDYNLDDFNHDSVAKHLNKLYSTLENKLIICIGHGSPYGLYYVNKYPEKCIGILCYPLRFYSQESYERRYWKYSKEGNNGWEKYFSKKYSYEEYCKNITNEKLKILQQDDSEEARGVIFGIYDDLLQKNHALVPKIFKIPSILFTRLDMDAKQIIEGQFKRKEVADMKKYFEENDALLGSCMWNFDRVKFNLELAELNKNNNNFETHYYVDEINGQKIFMDRIRLFIIDYQ